VKLIVADLDTKFKEIRYAIMWDVMLYGFQFTDVSAERANSIVVVDVIVLS
jgi:hypothetical protein